MLLGGGGGGGVQYQTAVLRAPLMNETAGP